MSYEVFEYKGKIYPSYIKDGNMTKFILPLAQTVIGEDKKVLDVGFGKEEWKYPESDGIDALMPPPFNDACNLPFYNETYDAVYSSHLIEHVPNFVDALIEFKRVLKKDGVLFLYLPSTTCAYWRPTLNFKHHHSMFPEETKEYLQDLGFGDIFVSQIDLAYSFAVYGKKK